MGGKKRNQKPSQTSQNQQLVQPEEGKRFVNLLHVYTIYKQKFRRLSKEQFQELIQNVLKGKKSAIELCHEFMKAKQITGEVSFEKNVGFLSVPRLMPLIALLAERAGYNIKPSIVFKVDFSKTPPRFQEKFAQLLVYGFWFLGRVITDSLSEKEQVNRGNMFNFLKGDLGFWWAGVRILDWNCYVHYSNKGLGKRKEKAEQEKVEEDKVKEEKVKEEKVKEEPKKRNPINCHSFVVSDPPSFQFYTSRAVTNMQQHPMYFLSEEDWTNYISTVKSVRHKLVFEPVTVNFVKAATPSSAEDEDNDDNDDEYDYDGSDCDDMWGDCDSYESNLSSFSSDYSVNTLASRESVD